MDEKKAKKPALTNKADVRLNQATKRIIKRRKEHGPLDQELAVFDEIRTLLEGGDESEVALPSQTLTPSSQEPKDFFGCAAFDPPAAFTIFTEDSLKLKLFVPADQTFLGFPVSGRNDQFFRNLLLSRAFELRGKNATVCQEIRLYVFYLAAATSNAALCCACFDFILNFPCSLTAKDVLLVFLNFGVKLEAVEENFQELDIPSYLLPGIDRREDFPATNIEKVVKYLSFCAQKKLLEIGPETKRLAVAVAKLSQDRHVRRCSLLPPLCNLLTTLVLEAEIQLGLSIAASWLHIPYLHPITQLEVCRISLRPLSPNLQHTLILLIINSILGSKLKFSTPLKIKDVQVVLRYCNKKISLSVIELRVIIELLISALPVVTAKLEDIQPINCELSALESMLVNCGDSSDLVKLSSAIAKLHSLVMIKGGSRFTAETNRLCSPRRPLRS